MALIATQATLASRIPFLHFFDGFRTSHEVMKIEQLTFDDMRAMIDEDLIIAHRKRALTPDRPTIGGTAQNPDVYFIGRETTNKFYRQFPALSRPPWTSSPPSPAVNTTCLITSALLMPPTSSSSWAPAP
jgi:pyruvate-ferredoxin/flavodoxin oxidoreductase